MISLSDIAIVGIIIIIVSALVVYLNNKND